MPYGLTGSNKAHQIFNKKSMKDRKTLGFPRAFLYSQTQSLEIEPM
jgi:hypothetical protein